MYISQLTRENQIPLPEVKARILFYYHAEMKAFPLKDKMKGLPEDCNLSNMLLKISTKHMYLQNYTHMNE